MEVDMKDLLARSGPISLRKMVPLAMYATLWKRRRHTMNEPKDIGCFVFVQVAKFSGVSARDNKNVSGIDLALVHECNRIFIFGNHTGFEFSR